MTGGLTWAIQMSLNAIDLVRARERGRGRDAKHP